MQRPLTISFRGYYISIVKNQAHRIAWRFQRIFNCITGRWYCSYCNKYHSKRTIEYDYSDGITDSVCSLGVAAAGRSLEEAMPGRKITQRQINLTAYQVDAMFNMVHQEAR